MHRAVQTELFFLKLVLTLTGYVCMYCTFMSVSNIQYTYIYICGEKMNCTNVSVEELLAQLTLVFSLHKHAPHWHQSLLIVGFFFPFFKELQ